MMNQKIKELKKKRKNFRENLQKHFPVLSLKKLEISDKN